MTIQLLLTTVANKLSRVSAESRAYKIRRRPYLSLQEKYKASFRVEFLPSI